MAFFLWKHEQTRQVFLGFVCLKKKGWAKLNMTSVMSGGHLQISHSQPVKA